MREITEHRCGVGVDELLRLEHDPESGVYHFYAKNFGEWQRLVEIGYQEGTVKESGPKGVSNQLLLATIIDRLRHSDTERENVVALTHLETALLWMKKGQLSAGKVQK